MNQQSTRVVLVTEEVIPQLTNVTGISADKLRAIMKHDEAWGCKAYFLVNLKSVPKYRYESAKGVLADREKELLDLKGPCSLETCRLHYAHSGPCDESIE